MRVGDTIELVIDSQGMNGEGVARHEGVVIFLSYTIKGEKVLGKILSVKKNFATARAVKILTPSPDRITPLCPVYFKCGSCDLMHIKSESHRALKEADLINNLKKIAGLDVSIDEWVDSDRQLGYRNKVQLPFGVVEGKVCLGYFAEGSHNFVPHDKCFLHDDWADNLSKIVLNFVNTRQISVYNEKTGRGLLRHLVMRKLGSTIAIILVINGDSVDGIAELIAHIAGQYKDFSLHLNINKVDTNVIMSKIMRTVYGKEKSFAEILGVKVAVSPLSFMQINDYIRDKIYLKIKEELQGISVLLDLYSGVGITSNVLADSCNKVYSIEIVEDAVRDAKELIALNGNQDIVTAICGDVAIELPKLINTLRAENLLQNELIAVDSTDSICNQDIITPIEGDGVIPDNCSKRSNNSYAVLLDPPRKGCDRIVLEKILETAPDKIIYISCNHATLARDINILKERYFISRLVAYDMFANTHNLETLICLTRK